MLAVENGESALQAWQGGEFDLVLSDCNMPVMNGYALARGIRRLERGSQSPAIAIVGYTANGMQEERARCLEAGMDECLVKPVALAQLVAVIEQLAPRHSFRMQTLQKMTQANTAVLQRMLEELLKNLCEESALLASAVEAQDWERIGVALHRLKGVACLIDALPLAQACAQLESARQGRSTALATSAWTTLKAAIDQLQQDIQQELWKMSPEL
ncbi:Virulence sensor protein BvgS precursor [compost metagenome]